MLKTIRILFVCSNNITLSPMAVQIFTHILRKKKILDYFKIDSAAVLEDAQEGIPISEGAKLYLEKVGIDGGVRTSKKLTKDMSNEFDWILCMTEFGRRKCFDIFKNDAVYVTPKDVKRVFKMDPASPISLDGKVRPRICCLMDFTGTSRDVIDPSKSGDYRTAFNEILLGCNSILSLLTLGSFI